jgi:hypothetical protein
VPYSSPSFRDAGKAGYIREAALLVKQFAPEGRETL